MKRIAIILFVLFLAAAGFTAYLFTACEVSVEQVASIVNSAGQQQELFSKTAVALQADALPGITFSHELDAEHPEDYQFVTYYIRIRNQCFLSADQPEVIVSPQEGDIAQLGTAAGAAIPGQTTGDIQVTILTRRDNHTSRALSVSYYMWGMPFFLKTAYNP